MSPPHNRRARAREDSAKRLLDLVAASAGLILLSPIIILVAVLVRASLGTPVLFRQKRPGLHGQPFTIYKFRTMREEFDGQGVRTPDVERTPALGRRLRSTSLDELPELWNVIRGDMSLVGPRPLMMQYLPRYTAHQMRRHEVRPGVTGLAQVSGRNALTWEQKFERDIEYVDRHDLRMDMGILLRTVRMVLAREGIANADNALGDMPEFMGTETSESAIEGGRGERV